MGLYPWMFGLSFALRDNRVDIEQSLQALERVQGDLEALVSQEDEL